MQTFVPYDDFYQSLACLDRQRLGKQRVETYQILKTFERRQKGIIKGWSNHVAAKMWLGYENALIEYYNLSLDIWESHGYKNNMPRFSLFGKVELPWWWGQQFVHDSHKSNLLRKDFEFYSKYGWKVPMGLPYAWPTGKNGVTNEFRIVTDDTRGAHPISHGAD
jgi:hypothetical protein